MIINGFKLMEKNGFNEAENKSIGYLKNGKDLIQKDNMDKADDLWKFFASPYINPIELHIIMSLYRQSNNYGIKFTSEQIKLIISNSLYLSKNSRFDFSGLPKTVDLYISKLTSHYFLNYDLKSNYYFFTKPGKILGEALFHLHDNEFQFYDSKYLEDIIINIRNILNSWETELNNLGYIFPPFTAVKLEELLILTELFLQKEQQLMNISQLEIHIYDLSQQSITIIEQLKSDINQIQVDYIEGIHQERDVTIIKESIQIKISHFSNRILQLNQKNADINDIVKKNEKNLNLIIKVADNLNLEFEKLLGIYTATAFEHKNKLNQNLIKLINLCQKLEDFTYQFRLTTFDVLINRINNIQHLFNYLKDLIQNSQLQGDLYHLWKFCIYENIQGKFSIIIKNFLFKKPTVLEPNINKIPMEEIDLKTNYDIKEMNLIEEIKSRNLKYNKNYSKEFKSVMEKLKEKKRFEELIEKIIEKIKNSEGYIDISIVIYNFCKNTLFEKSYYYPRIISTIWQRLLKEKDLKLLFTESSEKKESNTTLEFENKKIIKIQNKTFEIIKKGE